MCARVADDVDVRASTGHKKLSRMSAPLRDAAGRPIQAVDILSDTVELDIFYAGDQATIHYTLSDGRVGVMTEQEALAGAEEAARRRNANK